MAVPVVDIGKMRVAVPQRRMAVRVAVRQAVVPGEIMLVLVVGVVAVPVGVLLRPVFMLVLVPLAQVQVQAARHQQAGDQHGGAGRLAQQAIWAASLAPNSAAAASA